MMDQKILKIIPFNAPDRFRDTIGVQFVLWPLIKGGSHKNFIAIDATDQLVHKNSLTPQ
jgi:hypothetical protein